MIELTRSQRAAVDEMLERIREEGRFRGGLIIHEDGSGSSSWGCYSNDRTHERWGQPNGTKEDVARLKAELRRRGLTLTFDAADAVLSEAIWYDDGEGGWYRLGKGGRRIYADAGEQIRQKRKRQVDRRRELGLCTSCGVECVPRITCEPCNAKAVERNRRRRSVA